MNNKYETIDAELVVGAIARNCKKALEANIPRLEELCRFFKDYHIVIYENDSNDGTTELLKEWANKNPHILSINETTNETTIPKQSKGTPFPGQSYSRIVKMAGFRNRVLKEVRERFTPDLFCFIDIDIEEFEPRSVVDAIFNAPSDWGALFANGQVILDYGDEERISPIMYDYYAYTEVGVNPYQEGDYAVRLSDNLALAWVEQRCINRHPYHLCNSAFNGIGIYRWKAIEGLVYQAYQTPELKAVNAALCEHVPFNFEIVRRGFGNYVVRDMKTIMTHAPGCKHSALLSRWKNYFPIWDFFKFNKGMKKRIVQILFQRLRKFSLSKKNEML